MLGYKNVELSKLPEELTEVIRFWNNPIMNELNGVIKVTGFTLDNKFPS
jgi:hypothetical protein